MKKIISIILICVLTVCSSTTVFAKTEDNTMATNKNKINSLLSENVSTNSILEIDKEIDRLSEVGINIDAINSIDITEAGTKYTLEFGNVTEYLVIKNMDDN